jgi:hypothetical protein
MANLYSVPLKNSVQKTLAGTLTQAEVGTITLDSSVALELQATSSMEGLLVIDRVDVNGVLTPTKTEYISYTGVSGSTVTGLTRALAGTSAQGHSIGAIVEFVPDITWAQAINDVITEQHNSDGTHKTLSLISLASVTINNSIINSPLISGGSFASTTILTSNIDTFSFKNINAPEGFLINGKIVPSVASNNLTVALKTLAGTDATASDPIYVRIAGVVRSITSALSVTANAGTNYLDLGSAELATKEADLFVSLCWNTSGSNFVMLVTRTIENIFGEYINNNTGGKGRITGGSTSGIDSFDSCVVIGRFAGTLSAGAGFTWTVPTFTSLNLIQRPIYETRLLAFEGSILGGSTKWTKGNAGVAVSVYKIQGDMLSVTHRFNLGSTSSIPAGALSLDLPFSITTNVYPCVGSVQIQNAFDINGSYNLGWRVGTGDGTNYGILFYTGTQVTSTFPITLGTDDGFIGTIVTKI